jgi:hypothetical protein
VRLHGTGGVQKLRSCTDNLFVLSASSPSKEAGRIAKTIHAFFLDVHKRTIQSGGTDCRQIAGEGVDGKLAGSAGSNRKSTSPSQKNRDLSTFPAGVGVGQGDYPCCSMFYR